MSGRLRDGGRLPGTLRHIVYTIFYQVFVLAIATICLIFTVNWLRNASLLLHPLFLHLTVDV